MGELALHVLTRGETCVDSSAVLQGAPMKAYIGPEESRMSIRKKQSPMSKRRTQDILEAVRGGKPF